MALIIILAIFIILLIIGFHENKKEARYKHGDMTDEEKIKYEKKLKQRDINMQNFKNLQAKNKNSTTIKQVMIIGNQSDSRKKIGSTVIRGAIGNSLLGPVGLVGGAMSGKNKVNSTSTFLIEYLDGHKETKVVKNDSAEYKKLCNYIKMN